LLITANESSVKELLLEMKIENDGEFTN